MAIPDFITELRASIGTAPLWLSGVTAVVFDDARARVLLIRRSDTKQWAPITGIIDPGEQPAVAAAREAAEEAGVRISVDRLASVGVTGNVVYDNGDRAQYLDITFECRYVDGDPRPVDGEALEVAWFAVDALPDGVTTEFQRRIDDALTDGPARFIG
ncbi:NUDIX domain-containing protein [soil metagenome]